MLPEVMYSKNNSLPMNVLIKNSSCLCFFKMFRKHYKISKIGMAIWCALASVDSKLPKSNELIEIFLKYGTIWKEDVINRMDKKE